MRGIISGRLASKTDIVDVLTWKDLESKPVRRSERPSGMPAVSDAAMLRHLIEARRITQANPELRRSNRYGAAMSTISNVLNGRRTLTRSHIGTLATFFSVTPGCFPRVITASFAGTQWERLRRLQPEVIVVSTDLAERHRLPDVTGAAVFARYALDMNRRPLVALTGDTGTIEVIIDDAGNRAVNAFGDARHEDVDLALRLALTWGNNPTDWKKVLIDKANAL